MKIFVLLAVIFVCFSGSFQQKRNFLAEPILEKCKSRPRDITINGHNYFFSGHVEELKDKHVGWIEARNLCRQFCMDTISIDTEREFTMVKNLLEDFLVDYLWTSGQICDVPVCSKDPNLSPVQINGWFWAHNNVRMPPTDQNPPGWSFNPWSQTGFREVPQPDNAEFEVNRKNESCAAILHNVYDDGVTLHDVACYHKKPFICEDSDELLRIVNVV